MSFPHSCFQTSTRSNLICIKFTLPCIQWIPSFPELQLQKQMMEIRNQKLSMSRDQPPHWTSQGFLYLPGSQTRQKILHLYHIAHPNDLVSVCFPSGNRTCNDSPSCFGWHFIIPTIWLIVVTSMGCCAHLATDTNYVFHLMK